ncbi:MAG TPA: hypothetical protein VGM82_22885 [Gemmatimonadaceae bacterium]|jgi:hypothetical protein
MSKLSATLFIAAVVVVGCSKANNASDTSSAEHSAAAPAPATTTATFDGVGRARIGSTTAQLREVGAVPAATGADACRIVALDWLPAGTRVMLVNDTLVRVDMDSTSTVRTVDGAAVGDSEPHILQLYGKVETQAHKYDPQGRYLIVASPNDSTRRIIFETDGKTVRRYRVGRRPEVDYVEGCG